jgi:hypothetical protein
VLLDSQEKCLPCLFSAFETTLGDLNSFCRGAAADKEGVAPRGFTVPARAFRDRASHISSLLNHDEEAGRRREHLAPSSFAAEGQLTSPK